MQEDNRDARMDEIKIREGDGKAASMEEMVDWMFRVLSGGNADAYVMDVLRRAEATA